MSLENLMDELNPSQRAAATHSGSHALILAGAGCGKTKTIIARAAYLIGKDVPSNRIQILTFTRRAASEIVERVKNSIGQRSIGLNASTFHSWCTNLIRSAPEAFNLKNFSVIDRDDQLQLFRLLRGKQKGTFASAADICEIYSFARNTLTKLSEAIKKRNPEYIQHKDTLAQIMRGYEERKTERNYLDYDDVLALVANGLQQHPDLCTWISAKFDHILVDEMQDTNPLQWALLEPLAARSRLYCVGDDAQSIYGFRGADFANVHSFKTRLPDTTVYKLEDNYRSTQEILDLSNWLLRGSPISYDKELRAVRGQGKMPQLHTFENEWQLGRWVAEHIAERRLQGALWREHMILVRSGFSGRPVEQALLDREIPYQFIGGQKLLESAHVKDVLSGLRVVSNHRDELGWMRFLTLWPKIGEITATKLVTKFLDCQSLDECINELRGQGSQFIEIANVLNETREQETRVSEMIQILVKFLDGLLSHKYRNQDWERRRRDFDFVVSLAERHATALEFLEEYVLNPVFQSAVGRNDEDDLVTIITIHSAKGTERQVCYVVNVSPGVFPSMRSIGELDEVEEERRVLYVGLTRAQNELHLTRCNYAIRALPGRRLKEEEAANGREGEESHLETYFLNNMPDSLVEPTVHGKEVLPEDFFDKKKQRSIKFGIDLD